MQGPKTDRSLSQGYQLLSDSKELCRSLSITEADAASIAHTSHPTCNLALFGQVVSHPRETQQELQICEIRKSRGPYLDLESVGPHATAHQSPYTA